MSAQPEAAEVPGGARPGSTSAISPTVRQSARRGVFWIVGGIALVAFVVVIAIVRGDGGVEGTPLAADNPGVAGSKALAVVLEQQGVQVEIVGTLEAARSATGDGTDTTVFFSDPAGYLGEKGLEELPPAADTVIADPGFALLQAIAPTVSAGGAPGSASLPAECPLPAAARARSITAGSATLATDDRRWTGCFPAEEGAFGLVQRTDDDRTITLLADGSLLRNDTITEEGNAALALGLLGANPTLVWYQPTLPDALDSSTGPAPTIGELTPDWVTPTLLLLALVVVAAGIWRGRRFGALVIENLPVTVHASETMEGRARLYARTSSRLRAADALRIGAIGRISQRLALPRTMSVEEVAGGAASATGVPIADVRAVLLTDEPRTDRDLIALSDRLDDLERRVGDVTAIAAPAGPASSSSEPHARSRTHPNPTGRMDS